MLEKKKDGQVEGGGILAAMGVSLIKARLSPRLYLLYLFRAVQSVDGDIFVRPLGSQFRCVLV